MSGAVCADRHRAVIRHCRALPMPPRRSKNRPRISQARLEEMIKEATVDCDQRCANTHGKATVSGAAKKTSESGRLGRVSGLRRDVGLAAIVGPSSAAH